MERIPDQNPPGKVPRKTAWTAVWFAVIGGLAVVGHWLLTSPDPSADGQEMDSVPIHQAGPLPPAPQPAAQADLSDEDLEGIAPVTDTAAGFSHSEKHVHQSIEDPQGAALCKFYQSLEQLEKREIAAPVRILHYGDSILTTDQLSGHMRRILQRRFGDAGHGFVLLGKPWRWYRHLDVKHGANGNWRVRPVTSDPVADGMYGLGGVAFETYEYNAEVWAGTSNRSSFGNRVAFFDISYLAHPTGGTFELKVNGDVIEQVSTRSKWKRAMHRRIDVPPGRGRLKIKTLGHGKVRLFGVVLESDRPGIVYDSLAINGARASILARFNKQHWKTELERRDARLVVLMFGANEGHNEFLELEEYSEHLTQVIRTMRAGAPNAGFLVVGPLDQASRRANGEVKSRRMPAKLSQTQRQVALDQGCAFFDTFTAMGGKNSMAAWFKRGWGSGDLIHPTEIGARRIGSWITDALMAGYEQFLYGDSQCASNVTSL